MTKFREAVLRTSVASWSFNEKLTNGGLGLAGEAGEVVDLIKKVVVHGKAYDRDTMIKELGDVRWYLEYLAEVIDVSMAEIEETNIKKLEARYPNGFNTADANARRDLK